MTDSELAELRYLLRLAIARSREARDLEFGASACAGKQGFASHQEAADKIRLEARGLVQPYRCEFCNKWHLGGARSGKERRAIRARVNFRHRNHRRSW